MADRGPAVTPVTNAQPVDIPVTDRGPPVTLVTDEQSANTPVTNTQPLDTPDSSGELADTEYRRGKTVFFTSHQSAEVNKGMVINLTPSKQHVKVATNSKERPIDVALDCLTEPPPQPLKSQTFVISGNIAERGDKEKVNTEKLIEIVKSLGGTVFSGDVEKAADASFVVVTSQKEINKPTQKLNKTLTMAYRLGWKIISKQFIIEARNTNTLPSIWDCELDLANIRTAPANSVLHSKVLTNSTMINNHHVVGGHRELKKKIRGDSKRKKPDSVVQEKSLPKKPCTAYAMFSKTVWKSIVKEHPTFTMREVNSCVSELWKEVGDEDRRMYQQQAKENYENRIERFNSANRQY